MNDHSHFFIIGAQRSGTTYLYNVLDSHPEIQMAKPVRPEPKYFLRFDVLRNPESAYFHQFFEEDPGVRWYGEKSTTYYESKDAAKRIHALFPGSRIIIILRDPVYRAISNYLFSVKHGVEKRNMKEVFIEEKPFELENPDRFSTDPLAYLERGQYIDYLKIYSEIFPERNIKVLIFEEFVDNRAEISGLYRWLGVDDDFRPKSTGEKVNAFEGDYPEVDKLILNKLSSYFNSFNKELEQFLGRKLNKWKNDQV